MTTASTIRELSKKIACIHKTLKKHGMVTPSRVKESKYHLHTTHDPMSNRKLKPLYSIIKRDVRTSDKTTIHTNDTIYEDTNLITVWAILSQLRKAEK
jgi:hypothetical protein